MQYTLVKKQETLNTLLQSATNLKNYAFQDLDFSVLSINTKANCFVDCLFLGCQLGDMQLNDFKDCLIFPSLKVPFNVFINKLYTPAMLFEGYRFGEPESYADTFDQRIYRHFCDKGIVAEDIAETLSRSIHDNSITDALYEFIGQYDPQKIVGVVGGHGIHRYSRDFYNVAQISKQLTENGYLMVSGGGPGAMEATHLGAWMAGKSDDDLHCAIEILSQAAEYTHPLWLEKALEVLRIYPQNDFASIGIPTWHYGHEPSTPFASQIAKYFTNSIREDGLLTIAMGGIIITPGSAGTMQEIFQEATQNHYLMFGFSSPMAFLGRKYWNETYPVYPLLTDLQEQGKYKNLILSLSDSVEEVVSEIKKFTEND